MSKNKKTVIKNISEITKKIPVHEMTQQQASALLHELLSTKKHKKSK